jgi:hypothetical protein
MPLGDESGVEGLAWILAAGLSIAMVAMVAIDVILTTFLPPRKTVANATGSSRVDARVL